MENSAAELFFPKNSAAEYMQNDPTKRIFFCGMTLSGIFIFFVINFFSEFYFFAEIYLFAEFNQNDPKKRNFFVN